MIEDHKKLSRKITTSPIHQLDKQGQKLLKRINGSALNCDSDSGFSGMLQHDLMLKSSSCTI